MMSNFLILYLVSTKLNVLGKLVFFSPVFDMELNFKLKQFSGKHRQNSVLYRLRTPRKSSACDIQMIPVLISAVWKSKFKIM